MKERQKYLILVFLMADLAIVNGLFALLLVIYPDIPSQTNIREQWLALNAAYLPIAARLLISERRPMALLMEKVAKEAVIVVLFHAIAFLTITTLFGIKSLSPGEYLTYYGMLIVALPVWWIISRQILKFFRRKGHFLTNVVIIGTGREAMQLTEDLESDKGYGANILGYFDIYAKGDFTRDEIFFGVIENLPDFLKKNEVDRIYFATEDYGDRMFTTAVENADNFGIELYYVPLLPHELGRKYTIDTIGSTTLMSALCNPLSNKFNRIIKRSFDICFSLVVIAFYPLIYIPVAIAIKRSSPGPVYFKQRRTGYHGKEFECLKFRTMRVNDDADTRQATQDDPRKTKVGEFLRHTSIDELPQFFNILRGDMSVVGPRPHMIIHTDQYSKLISKYMLRLAVKPGLTGWAQVKGYRGATDRLWKMEKRVKCDVWYVENWSFLLDMKIIFRTVINMFIGEKDAY